MKNLFQPVLTDLGTLTLRGQDFVAQRLSYGSQHHTYIFRKAQIHRHGQTFSGQREYNLWRSQLGAQRELF